MPLHFTAVPPEVTAEHHAHRTGMHTPAILVAPGTSMHEAKAELVLQLGRGAGAEAGQRRGRGASSPRTDPFTHTQPRARAGRTSLTCFQLEMVCRKGVPRQGQGCHRLEMRDVLLYVCRGVANAVRKKPFNYSSWHENQSAPRNVVTNCHVI